MPEYIHKPQTKSKKAKAEIAARMQAAKTPVELMWDIYAGDPLTWGQQLFPQHFSMQTPSFHYELIDSVRDHRFVAIAAPRSSAKSTLMVFLYPFHQIIFKKRKFILIVSNTFAKAAMHLDSIKKELAENETLKRMFPGITLSKDAQGDTIFRHQDGHSTLVLCKGVDQIGGVRGVKFGASRPDLILCDDMEDDELVRSHERREQLNQLYDEALIPAGSPDCQVVVIGTIFHFAAQMAKLVSPDLYQEYFKLFFRAIEDDGRSLWPEKWSIEFLTQLQKDKPNVFAKEYQNNPVAGQNIRFKRADFRYWKEEGSRILILHADGSIKSTYSFKDCRAAIACDLAWKEKRTSDSSIIMPGLLTPNSEILVCEYLAKKGMRPDETGEQLFIMVERLEALTGSTVPVGFEKAMLENVTQWLLKREMKKRNKFLLTKELVWDADKNTRIETRLEPRYSQHVIFHRQGMGDLEQQLEQFPSGEHDDLPDALQGLVQLLQFPKVMKQAQDSDDEFMRARQLIVDAKKPTRRLYNGRPERGMKFTKGFW